MADTPILIHLETLGHLGKLGVLFEHVRVPLAVRSEFLRKSEALQDSSRALLSLEAVPFRDCDEYDSPVVELLRESLGRGESESIAQAQKLSADFVLTDDGAARRRAERFGLQVMGTARILARLCLAGWIDADEPGFHELIRRLRSRGSFITDAVAGEAWRRERDGT